MSKDFYGRRPEPDGLWKNRTGAIYKVKPFGTAPGQQDYKNDQNLAADTQLRIAVLDRDTGFLQVLSKRLDRLGWEYRVVGAAVPVQARTGRSTS